MSMSNLIFELQFQSASSHLSFKFQLQTQLKVELGPVQPQLVRYNFNLHFHTSASNSNFKSQLKAELGPVQPQLVHFFIFSFRFNFLCTHFIHLLPFSFLNSSTNVTPSLLLFNFTSSIQTHIFINDFFNFQLNCHTLSSYFIWFINSNCGFVRPSSALASQFLLRSK